MKKKVSVEGKERTAEVHGDLLLLDGRECRVRSADLEKRRKEPVFKMIVTMVVLLFLGSMVFLFLQYALGGEEQGDPYLELDETNEMDLRTNPAFPASSLFLEGTDPVFYDLEENLEYDARGDMDVFRITDNTTGYTTLNMVWTGDVVDLMQKGISVMEVKVDSPAGYRLDSVSFLLLDEDSTIDQQRKMTLSDSLTSRVRTGSSSFEVRFERLEMGKARSMQLDGLSRYRACWISLALPDGAPAGEHSVSVSYGPEYYHESTYLDLFLAGLVALITLLVAGLVLVDMMKELPVLAIVCDDGDELVLYGEEKELSALNYELSKVMISRMRSREEEPMEGEEPKEFRVDKREREKMKEEMNELPGRPGKIMIQQCPECGSSELYYESGFITGYVYHCKRCDYIGSFVIENELDLEE